MSTADSDAPGRIDETILDLLHTRGPGKTICPSEVARVLAGDEDFGPYMDPVREAAGRMVDSGKIVVTQKGRRVSATEAHGPIRLGLPER